MVGIGPGGPLDRTRRAEETIALCSVIVGYSRYLDLVRDLTAGKKLISSGMTKEVERCTIALERARRGDQVALISSGDPGVYGMAGLVLEIAQGESASVPIEIVPGVASANAAAARLGAPLMCDYATISLSDLLVPWDVIQKRVEAVAKADFVVAIYNPQSATRKKQLTTAAAIFRKYRSGATPVGIGTAVGTANEKIVLTDLDHFLTHEINMRSIVIVGNSSSKVLGGCFVTPRGYKV
ncbi:MAG: precorrin-3B C(17)-methyltransferase [Syntrophales bacterium]